MWWFKNRLRSCKGPGRCLSFFMIIELADEASPLGVAAALLPISDADGGYSRSGDARGGEEGLEAVIGVMVWLSRRLKTERPAEETPSFSGGGSSAGSPLRWGEGDRLDGMKAVDRKRERDGRLVG
ncbi:hypothetical protein DAEQUDRAFT_377180 [Daedalea quercina L-15889]|uniref:Uncharacterized protein n=1 Tax=Daedalea quercina L-15889 TaxID=1314783 RepID=A0A165P360_9APHY|nr:hypothetical protein DAEQUDRAFT_377180 [Daedalea quercina L-15889]